MPKSSASFLKLSSCLVAFALQLPCQAQAPPSSSPATTAGPKGSADSELAELERRLKANPNDFRLHFALARAYETVGMHGLAEQEDELCDRAGPQFHKYVLQLFKENVARRDYATATKFFRYVERRYPNDPSVLLVGAIILDHQGRLAEAQEHLETILKINPAEPGVCTFFGALRLKQGRVDDAGVLFDAELKFRPGFTEAIIGKAKVLEHQGRYRDALTRITDLYRTDPLRRGLADSVAECYTQLNLYDEAATPALCAIAAAQKDQELKKAKKRVISIWPHLSPKTRKQAWMTVMRYLDATKSLAHARHFHFGFGDALLSGNFWEEAQVQFLIGLKLEPNHARAYFHLGEIAQYRQHNLPEAITLYTQALSYTPPEKKFEASFRHMMQTRIERLKTQVQGERKNIAGRMKMIFAGVKEK
jgi:tetratricopeptide (TPR) repeat protein